MTAPLEPSVAVELERLRGAVDTGFATLNGRLDVALQRTDQTERALAQLRADVEALKKNRWPLPAIGALSGVAGVVASLFALVR